MIFFTSFTIIRAAEFDIEKFSEPEKYGWKNHKEQLEVRGKRFEKQKLLQIYNLRKQTYVGNIIKSAIAPGWGHFVTDQPTKGLILLGSEIVLIGTSYYFFDRSMEYYNKYKNANYIANIKQYYNDANTPFTYSQIFFSLAFSVWIYSVYDSINATDVYNGNLWQKILLEEKERKLQISPTGITLRF